MSYHGRGGGGTGAVVGLPKNQTEERNRREEAASTSKKLKK
jgi:hypothetical protein